MTTRTPDEKRRKAGKKSRNKGIRGEAELSEVLSNLLGIEGYRTKQRKGDPDAPDVSDEGRLLMKHGLHIECKRDESTIGLNLYKALEQARKDAWHEDVPVVFSRRNHKQWVFAIDAEDLVKFCERVLAIKNETT